MEGKYTVVINGKEIGKGNFDHVCPHLDSTPVLLPDVFIEAMKNDDESATKTMWDWMAAPVSPPPPKVNGWLLEYPDNTVTLLRGVRLPRKYKKCKLLTRSRRKKSGIKLFIFKNIRYKTMQLGFDKASESFDYSTLETITLTIK